MINKDLLMEFFKDDDIKVVDKDFYIKSQMKSDVIKYITILEEENKGLKEELNRMFNRKVNAIKYIGREMIHDALYPASKVDGMKIIELLNAGDE